MLDDVYMEYLIKRKKDAKQIAIIVLIIAAAAFVSLALFFLMFGFAYASVDPQTGTSSFGSFIFGIGLVLMAFAWYGAYLLITMQNIEYEYILTNSEMDIDKVMSKRGRKSFVSFNFKDIIICAAVEDNEHKHEYNRHTDKTYDTVGDYGRGNVYFADFMEGSGRVRVLFQPTSKMINAAKRYNMRNIFVNE